jgi:hypothetical protein
MVIERSGQGRTEIEPLPFEDLRTTGMLWAINKYLLHPQGFALVIYMDGGKAIGWQMLGDGTEDWVFESDEPEESLFKAFRLAVAERTDG